MRKKNTKGRKTEGCIVACRQMDHGISIQSGHRYSQEIQQKKKDLQNQPQTIKKMEIGS